MVARPLPINIICLAADHQLKDTEVGSEVFWDSKFSKSLKQLAEKNIAVELIRILKRINHLTGQFK